MGSLLALAFLLHFPGARSRHLRALSSSDAFNGCKIYSGSVVTQPKDTTPTPWSGNAADFFGDYRVLADIERYLDLLHTTYPAFVTINTIGKSWEGRPLHMLEITEASVVAAEKPVIFLQGALHAREWISPATVLFIASTMLKEAGAEGGKGPVTDLLRHFVLAVLPVANPDGYVFSWTTNRMWRKTRSNRTECAGVDPNRNWDYMWAVSQDLSYVNELRDPCSNVYAGPEAFSEPEVRAIASYIERRQERSLLLYKGDSRAGPGHVAAFVDYHSFAQMLLPPWAHTPSHSPDHDFQMELSSVMAGAMKKSSGRKFEVGPNLFPSDPGTAPDWAYGAMGIKASLTVELEGDYHHPEGFCLSSTQVQSVGEEQWKGLLALAYHLQKHGLDPSTQVGLYAPKEPATGTTTSSPRSEEGPGDSASSFRPMTLWWAALCASILRTS